MYKQDGYYADATERGIKFDDPDVGIEWPIPSAELEDVRARPQRAASARHRRLAAVRVPGLMRARASRLAEGHPTLVAFALFACLAAVSRPASYQKPIERDTGQLLYVGHLVARGATPYVDAAFNEGPMSFLTFAVVDSVTFTKVVLVRLVLVLFAAAAALGVATAVGSRAGRAAGLLAGITLALLAAASPIQGDDPNTEQFGIAFLAGAWGLATLPGTLAAAGSGAAMAAGAAFNPLFAVVAPVIALELWASPREGRVKRLAVAVGGGLAILAALAVWLGATGALDDMWHQVVGRGGIIRHPGGAATIDPSLRVGGLGGTLQKWFDAPAGALFWMGVVGAAVALRRRELRVTAAAAMLWIALVWLRAELQSYTFPHHFYIALPGIAGGIAVGVASLWQEDLRARAALAALVLALPFAVYVAGPQLRQLELPVDRRWSLDTPEDWSLAYPVARYIDEHTRPGARIFMTGSHPEVYWLADRRAMTRYFDFFPALSDPVARRERMRDLEERPPAAIGVMSDPDAHADLDTLRAYMDRHRYVIALQLKGAQVWLPRGAG